jgi:hypothetical protein
MPQLSPQQFGAGHVFLTGQEGSRGPAVWAAGTLSDLVNRSFPQAGQAGFSLPRMSSSNSWPQSSQAYS